MVAGLTLVLLPAEVVPIAFLLEIASSLHMLPLVLKDLDWHRLLLLNCGVHLLSIVPHDRTRWLVLLLMLVAILMLLRGKRLKGNAEGKRITFSVGLISGFVNGSTAVGGLPVVLILLSTST